MNNRSKMIAGATALAISIITGLVTFYEGDKETAYKDPVGIATAGVGHTGKDVVVGKKYSKEQRQKWLKEDLTTAGKVVASCTDENKIDIHQRAAFISLAFNIGAGKKGVKDGFCHLKKTGNPSSVARYANLGMKVRSCTAILSWNKAGGKVLPGLTKRRKAEYTECMKSE